jgi:flagellar biosynthesis protein FlhF
VALEIFTGDHLPTLLTRIREALGPDACVVQLKRDGAQFQLIASDGSGPYAPPAVPVVPPLAVGPDFREVLRTEYERDRPDPVVAARPEPIAAPRPSRWAPPPRAEQPAATSVPIAVALRAEPVKSAPTPAVAPVRPPYMVRPWVVALVGPTGAGKTTTIAKLATNRLAFGSCRVGLIGLDTYRVGAVEQLETYADLADLPVEIAYSEAEVTRALARLNDCEVVLVDTPGRGPRNTADTETIRGWLSLLAPDEVHLTLPAAQLPAVTRRLLRSYEAFGVTHLLATKLDEYPAETAIFTIAQEHLRRMRWVTDGQEVPVDLRDAGDVMATALGRRDGALLLESVA